MVNLGMSIDGVRGVAREVSSIGEGLAEAKSALTGVTTGGNDGFAAQREIDALLGELSTLIDARTKDIGDLSTQLSRSADAVQTNEENATRRVGGGPTVD